MRQTRTARRCACWWCRATPVSPVVVVRTIPSRLTWPLALRSRTAPRDGGEHARTDSQADVQRSVMEAAIYYRLYVRQLPSSESPHLVRERARTELSLFYALLVTSHTQPSERPVGATQPTDFCFAATRGPWVARENAHALRTSTTPINPKARRSYRGGARVSGHVRAQLGCRAPGRSTQAWRTSTCHSPIRYGVRWGRRRPCIY